MANKKTSKKIKFSKSPVASDAQNPNSQEMAQALSQQLRVQEYQKNSLFKSVQPVTIKKEYQQKYDRIKVAFSSKEHTGSGFDGVETKSGRRLTDTEQKELSQVDPYISAIISTRCSQAAVCGRISESKFDKGTRIVELNPVKVDDFESKEAFERETNNRKKHMNSILNWVMKCGSENADLINSVFDGMDPTFKYCTFSEFLTAQVRNLLTFGRCGTHIIRNDAGIPVLFRPVPIETIYPVIRDRDIHLTSRDETAEESEENVKEYNELELSERPVAYVQRIEGQNINFLTEQDLKVSYFQKQALFDLDGYPLSPIEQAIYMVYTHQQTLSYLRNQFVKGLGNKGIIGLESTDPSVELSDEDLQEFRNDFHNFVNRNDNSAAIPVLSGPVKVNFIPLSPTPRDMEFLQVEEHIIRALCSAMQISPQEMGYGNLSIGQGGLTQANKQEEIVKGEERGLRMLLDTVYDLVNEIVSENFPEVKDKYLVSYVGVGEDTKDSVINQGIQELQTTATLSSLWADSEKKDTVPFGGGVPLSPLFHQNVVRYMKYGTFIEEFFGIEGASKMPEYDFIIDPSLNQAYQALRVQSIEKQKEAADLQMEGQELQMKQMEAQMQMQEQQGDPNMQQAVAQSGDQQEQSPDQEQKAKSLKEEYAARQQMQKSMSSYFSEWIRANEEF